MSEPKCKDVASPTGSLCLYFGWWALLCYLTLGFTLEILHGLKIPWYLEFETRRLMWTLGHAHGALLALINIVFGIMLRVLAIRPTVWQKTASISLVIATILLPGGFFLGGLHVYGADPGIGVLLVPLGAASLFIGVLLTAIKAPFLTKEPTSDSELANPQEDERDADLPKWE